MPTLEPLTPDRMDDAQRALYELITSGPRRSSQLVAADGSLRGPFDPMLRSPAVGEPLQALGAAIRFAGQLDASLRELAILVTAARWQCRFEWDAHLPLAEAAGVPRDEVEPVWNGDAGRLSAPQHQEVALAVHQLLTDRAVAPDTLAKLLATHGEAATFELLVVVGYYSTLAGVMNTFEIS
jgi:4-carboxymuconolactone decarboxylase